MSSETTSTTNQRFDNMVTMLIASVAIWVAITAYFQNYAGNLSDQGRRRAQQYAIEATKSEVNGNIQFSYDWQGAFQTWHEIDLQRTAAEQDGDTAAVERYKKLQDRILSLSKLLGRDYFDATAGWPDTNKYQSDTYLVESTRLSETYIAEAELGNFTDNIADGLIVQITLLTVSLSLYGLSLALSGRVRWLFVIIGSGIVGLCMLWMGKSLVQFLVRPEVNQDAITAYAQGVGLAYQGKLDDAIGEFTLAIQDNPRYGKAYYQRALAYYDKGDLPTSISEMQAARQHGLDDVSLNWNLGWTYYLSGQFPQAVETNTRVLTDHPEVLGVRMNQAISYLSMGDIANSQAQYDLLIQEAQRQVDEAHKNKSEPSASLWYYMDAGAVDLQNLIDTLDNNKKTWTQAPSSNLITGDPKAIRKFADEQMKRIKETVVALEYTGQLPGAQEVMKVTPFIFGTITGTDQAGSITGFEPATGSIISYGAISFTVQFTYTGPPPKQLVWKVYVNGTEDPSLRIVSNADISSGATWYRTFGYDYTNVFILAAGEYTVELFADNHLVQHGTFQVK